MKNKKGYYKLSKTKAKWDKLAYKSGFNKTPAESIVSCCVLRSEWPVSWLRSCWFSNWQHSWVGDQNNNMCFLPICRSIGYIRTLSFLNLE